MPKAMGVGVEPGENQNTGVTGTIVARYWSNLSYFDSAEISFDNEPFLAAGIKMAQTMRYSQGRPPTPQPGNIFEKSRTNLAERAIKTVRTQTKCLIAFLGAKMEMVIPEDHVIRGWAIVEAGWLVNRFHVTTTNGVTAIMSLRGRPYRGTVFAFGEEVYALDSFQQKHQCQWRTAVG